MVYAYMYMVNATPRCSYAGLIRRCIISALV